MDTPRSYTIFGKRTAPAARGRRLVNRLQSLLGRLPHHLVRGLPLRFHFIIYINFVFVGYTSYGGLSILFVCVCVVVVGGGGGGGGGGRAKSRSRRGGTSWDSIDRHTPHTRLRMYLEGVRRPAVLQAVADGLVVG